MEDISRRISELLSDPQTLEQIKGLAGMLGQGAGGAAQPSAESVPSAEASYRKPQQPDSMPDPDMLGMVMKLAPLFKSMDRDDDSTRLLRALRPFLHEERSRRLDGAIRLLGIMRMLPLLKGAGLELF